MKVILIQNVDKLGKKYDLKDVKKGHAMNYLIPNDLARPATKEALKWREVQLEITQKKQIETLKETQVIVSKIDGSELIFPVKVGEKDQLFESITIQKIKDRLEEMNFNIQKSQIELKNSIKELGEFSVKISFDHNLEATIKIIVTEEK